MRPIQRIFVHPLNTDGESATITAHMINRVVRLSREERIFHDSPALFLLALTTHSSEEATRLI